MPALGGGRGAKPAPKRVLQGFWGQDKKKGGGASDEPSPIAAITQAGGQGQRGGGMAPSTQGQPSKGGQEVALQQAGATAVQPATQTAQRGRVVKVKPAALVSVPVDKVKISGNVVLNIIKQTTGHEQSSKVRTGQIYGLKYPTNGMTEVTFSIACPDTTKTRSDDADYCKALMGCVDSTGVDKMSVGWYRTAVDGNFFDESTINRCSEWQRDINPDAFMIVYDASATMKTGRLVLRCFQLTKHFLGLHAAGSSKGLGHTAMHMAGITFDNVFREIPVTVHNSYLAHAFLFEHQNTSDAPFDRLAHNDNSDVSLALQALEKCIDDYQPLQSEYRAWCSKVSRVLKERERAEESGHGGGAFVAAKYPFPPEPSRLKSVLVLAEMAEHARRMRGTVVQTQANLQIQAGLDTDPLKG